MALDLKADVLYQYATDVATWQMDRIFSNPLASPDTLGVSSGAAFGAALGILISNNPLAPQAMAVFFGLVAIAATFLLSRIRQDSTVLMIVLGGVITSAFFSAGVSALKYLADPLTKLPEITYWLMGSMVASSYQDVLISLCLIALPVGMMFLLRWKLNVLMLPDDEAASLGVKAKTMRWLIILLGTLIIAASVSVCGQIGWVGLVIPHMARRVVGSDHQYSLPASISIGGTYLMLIDTVSRSLTSSELPLSILTAIIGVPIFVMLFFRKGPALLTLEVKDGCFSYGSHRVLRDVNLKVDSCDIMAILGRNGIGKTTLLKCIMGMLP